jgi:hypothetical protein
LYDLRRDQARRWAKLSSPAAATPTGPTGGYVLGSNPFVAPSQWAHRHDRRPAPHIGPRRPNKATLAAAQVEQVVNVWVEPATCLMSFMGDLSTPKLGHTLKLLLDLPFDETHFLSLGSLEQHASRAKSTIVSFQSCVRHDAQAVLYLLRNKARLLLALLRDKRPCDLIMGQLRRLRSYNQIDKLASNRPIVQADFLRCDDLLAWVMGNIGVALEALEDFVNSDEPLTLCGLGKLPLCEKLLLGADTVLHDMPSCIKSVLVLGLSLNGGGVSSGGSSDSPAATVSFNRATLSKEWPFGDGGSTPHIHQYPGGFHLKILDGGRVRRINLVQNGIPYLFNIAEALALANTYDRETGATLEALLRALADQY